MEVKHRFILHSTKVLYCLQLTNVSVNVQTSLSDHLFYFGLGYQGKRNAITVFHFFLNELPQWNVFHYPCGQNTPQQNETTECPYWVTSFKIFQFEYLKISLSVVTNFNIFCNSTLCSFREYTYFHHKRDCNILGVGEEVLLGLIGISRGWRKSLLWGRYGYFMELNIMLQKLWRVYFAHNTDFYTHDTFTIKHIK